MNKPEQALRHQSLYPPSSHLRAVSHSLLAAAQSCMVRPGLDVNDEPLLERTLSPGSLAVGTRPSVKKIDAVRRLK